MTFQISVVSSMATRQVLADLAAAYERQTGIQVTVAAMGGVEAARQIRAGKPTDLVVLASGVMEDLEAEGYLIPGRRANFALSGIAVAVRSGSPRPVISSEDAVKQAMVAASRIAYSTGPSGDHLMRLWERWGIAATVSRRAVKAPPGVPVGTLVARGEADLGVQQLSELLHVPGVEIVGPLPAEIQSVTVFSAAIARTSSRPDEGGALIAYLTSPEAEAAKRCHGMKPAERANA
jgi:molybdate transport system substrate-binding protein